MRSQYKVGFIVGSFFATWHMLWAILVVVGIAQQLLDWVFELHFIEPLYAVTTFHFGTFVLLILVTFGLGFLFGWAIALAVKTFKK